MPVPAVGAEPGLRLIDVELERIEPKCHDLLRPLRVRLGMKPPELQAAIETLLRRAGAWTEPPPS